MHMNIKLGSLLLFPALLYGYTNALSAPFTPLNDNVVLEHLPFKAGDSTTRELRRLRAGLSADPLNLDKAVVLSQRYFELAMAEGDPRFIGYAQAVLAPWWEMAEPPLPALVMRASLRQYNHDFVYALSDLDQATRREPRNGAAWSLLAAVHMVQADYSAARKDCANLHGLASKLIVLACGATVDSLSGSARQAYADLRKAYAASPDASPAARLWSATRLAEMADRLGLVREADAWFQAALQLDITDAYLQAVYAEFLLDEQRYREVVALLQGKERSDVLLVRLALAEKALASPLAKEHEQAIRARFDAARLRGDKLHIQDEARFHLYFLNDAQEALRLARENWLTQHEPGDARMLLEAALAAGDAAAAKPALEWFSQSHIEDRHLQRLITRIAQLGAKP